MPVFSPENPDFASSRFKRPQQSKPLWPLFVYFSIVAAVAGGALTIYLLTKKPEPNPPNPENGGKDDWQRVRELIAVTSPNQERDRRVALDIEKKILSKFPNHGAVLPISIEGVLPRENLALSRNGRTFAFVDSGLTAWDLEFMQKKHFAHRENLSMALSPDGKLCILGGDNLRLWDLEAEKVTKDIAQKFAYKVGFSPDGKNLVSYLTNENLFDGRFRRWDVDSGKELSEVPDCSSVQSFAFSPNGSILALAKDQNFDGVRIELWDYRSITKLVTLQPDPQVRTRRLVFSPDGKILALGGERGPLAGKTKPYLKLIDLSSEQNHDYSADLATDVWGLSFSPDGTILAVEQAADGTAFFDVSQRKLRKHFRPGVVRHSQFFPGGSLFITVGRMNELDVNDVIRVWQVSKIIEAD